MLGEIMARLASDSKGGYYPTPPKEMDLVLRKLSIKQNVQGFSVLDPCCGTGAALEQMANKFSDRGTKIKTYGVELEQSRAMEAVFTLDHVISDGYENLRTQPYFSCLFLNPPYQDGFDERVETTFLRVLTGQSKNVLQENGILVFIIPQHVLKDCAGVLSSRFSDITVYRFTDTNYPNFKQVVVYGRFKRPQLAEKKTTQKKLKEIASLGPTAVPALDMVDGITYELQPSQPITTFRGGVMKIDELAKDIGESNLFEEAEELLSNSAMKVSFERPILELKAMHYSVAIMADADRGGNMGDHLLVSGVVKRRSHKEKTNDDGDITSEELTEFYKSRVRIFSRDGVFDLE